MSPKNTRLQVRAQRNAEIQREIDEMMDTSSIGLLTSPLSSPPLGYDLSREMNEVSEHTDLDEPGSDDDASSITRTQLAFDQALQNP
jgi:hypothetical protein